MLVVRRAYSRAAAKAKGRRFQQQIAEVIKTEFPFLTGNDVRSTPMGCPGVDIILSPKAQTALPYEFELKCCESLSIWSVIEQSLKRLDVTSGMVPCIVAGKNRTKPVAVVPLGHWLNLVLATDQEQPRLNQFPNMTTLGELENLYLAHSSISPSTSTSLSLDETCKLQHTPQAKESTSRTMNLTTTPETKLLRCVQGALDEIDCDTPAVVRENLILFRNWGLSARCSARLNVWKIFPGLQNWLLDENKTTKGRKTKAKTPTAKCAETSIAKEVIITKQRTNTKHFNPEDRNAALVLGRHRSDGVFVVLSFRVFLDLVIENNFGEHRLS
eukprot:m.125445 g.125445  ORF g.125445 m.125445 type:complete len:329 (-) comp29130_c0_seq3:72-1058(-)